MAVNTVLAIVKIAADIVGNSYPLIGAGIESPTDIVSSLMVWTGLKISSLPADDDHPLGSRRVGVHPRRDRRAGPARGHPPGFSPNRSIWHPSDITHGGGDFRGIRQ